MVTGSNKTLNKQVFVVHDLFIFILFLKVNFAFTLNTEENKIDYRILFYGNY